VVVCGFLSNSSFFLFYTPYQRESCNSYHQACIGPTRDD
jgi:hypothetical protein